MVQVKQTKLKGNSVGIVFGSFAPLHQGHLDAIMRAKKENDGGCIVIVCGYDGDKGEPLMPHKRRYRYVREFFADDDLVAVYAINDSELGIAMYPDGWDEWLDECNKIWELAVSDTGSMRYWYVGELEYKEGLEARGEEAFLLDRKENLISSTMIRDNPIKHWDKITAPFKRVFSTNILIAGTASEGKSVLVQDLGKYFNAPYSYEWAKDYLTDSCIDERELEVTDFMAFLQGQYDLHKDLINSQANHGLFFADSDALVTRMYAEYYAKDDNFEMPMKDFKVIADMADEITSKCKWDKIFLLSPYGEFVDDGTRYMGHLGMKEREELFEILCNNIKRCGLWDKVTIINGGYYKNFITISKYVKGIIENGKG